MTDTSTLPSILIVDDTPANLNVLSAILSGQGYRVRAAPNGQGALKTAQKSPPDLILLDIQMPDMNGYEVCAALKAAEETRHVPVIFISALDDGADKVEGFRVGGVDYITKPFQIEEVVARVENHLRLHQQQMALWRAAEYAQAALDAAADLPGADDLRAQLTALLETLSDYA